MARTDGDNWDVSESVGATALGAAEWRAWENTSERPLFIDPYANVFLDAAVASGTYSRFGDDMVKDDPKLLRGVQAQRSFVASRTKWFDDFFTAADAAGIRQAVILAAGLDARAWRLPWRPGSTVYEIDQPRVLAFKSETLRAHGAEPAVRYVPVPIDLRHNWPKTLCDTAFRADQPTAWSVEGLLVYLPAAAQVLLFDQIHALSAVGSRIAVEALSAAFFEPENLARLKGHLEKAREALVQSGGDTVDVPELLLSEKHSDVNEWLVDHGWDVDATDIHDQMKQYDRMVPAEDAAGIPQTVLIEGRLR